MNLKIVQLTIIVMSECRQLIQKMVRPWILAVGICATLWALLLISTIHSWTDEHLSFTSLVYRLFPIYVHIGSLLLVCIVVSGMSWFIFYRNDFVCCFSTMGFLFYVLAEITMMVNALTMENKSEIKFYIESLILFVLLFAYTSVVSWEYSRYTERQRILHEEFVNRQISTKLSRGGNCYRLPLKGPSRLALNSKKSSATSGGAKPPPTTTGTSNKK